MPRFMSPFYTYWLQAIFYDDNVVIYFSMHNQLLIIIVISFTKK